MESQANEAAEWAWADGKWGGMEQSCKAQERVLLLTPKS